MGCHFTCTIENRVYMSDETDDIRVGNSKDTDNVFA